MDENLELALNRIAELERKLEKYFEILQVQNELDFILKGGYLRDADISSIISGEYE